MKIKVAIIDKDENYAKRLIGNFQVHYADKIEPYYFSNPAVYLDFSRKKSIQVVLVSDEFAFDPAQLSENIAFSWLSSDNTVERINGYSAIGKFQKAELLYKNILGLYADVEGNKVLRHGDMGRCYVFTSAQGGVGVTTTAAAYALYLAQQGEKPIFLSMDPFTSTALYFNGDGNQNFSDVIYALKAQRGTLTIKLESIIREDASGVRFFAECRNPIDFFEMKTADWEKLVDALRSMEGAGSLVIDLPMQIDSTCKAILTHYSDRTIWVSDGSASGNVKIQRLMQALKIYIGEKDYPRDMALLYNHAEGGIKSQLSDLELNVIGDIPSLRECYGREVMKNLTKQQAMSQIG